MVKFSAMFKLYAKVTPHNVKAQYITTRPARLKVLRFNK